MPTALSRLQNAWTIVKKNTNYAWNLGSYNDDQSTQKKINVENCIPVFFFSMALPAHSGSWPRIQFRNHFSQTVGLLGWVISPSQGLYLNTGQHKLTPNIHALSGIRTHDPSVRANADSSCFRPRGYCDRLYSRMVKLILSALYFPASANVWSGRWQ
jgi:hypothetical protein